MPAALRSIARLVSMHGLYARPLHSLATKACEKCGLNLLLSNLTATGSASVNRSANYLPEDSRNLIRACDDQREATSGPGSGVRAKMIQVNSNQMFIAARERRPGGNFLCGLRANFRFSAPMFPLKAGKPIRYILWAGNAHEC